MALGRHKGPQAPTGQAGFSMCEHTNPTPPIHPPKWGNLGDSSDSLVTTCQLSAQLTAGATAACQILASPPPPRLIYVCTPHPTTGTYRLPPRMYTAALGSRIHAMYHLGGYPQLQVVHMHTWYTPRPQSRQIMAENSPSPAH